MSSEHSWPSMESGGDSGNRGDHILKQGSGMIMRPSWSKSDPTVFRPFPIFEAGVPQPTRYQDGSPSRWYFECALVSSFGNPQKSWIAYDPADKNYDTRMNPASLVYAVADNVSKGKLTGPQAWALAIKGGAGKSAAVSRPDKALIIRGAIYEYKGIPKNPVDGLADHHQTVFMVLKKTAWQAMLRELGVRKPGVSSTDNFNDMFMSGDLVSLTDGAYLVFHEIDMPPRGYDSSFKAEAAPSYASKYKPVGYNCIVSKVYRGPREAIPATFNAEEIEGVARRASTPIFSHINFPSDEEQVRFIVDSMRDCPAHAGLVIHALRDRYERFLPVDFINYGNEFLRQNNMPYSAPAGAPAPLGFSPSTLPVAAPAGVGHASAYAVGHLANPTAPVAPVVPGPAPYGHDLTGLDLDKEIDRLSLLTRLRQSKSEQQAK